MWLGSVFLATTISGLPRIKLEYDPAMQGNNGNVVSSVSRWESQTDENGVAELLNLVPGANYLLRLRGPVAPSEYDVSNNAEYRHALHEELKDQLIPVDVNANPGETIDLGDILVETGNK